MKVTLYLYIAKLLYSSVLRDLLIKTINDPEEDWDDTVLIILDVLFKHKG